LDFSSTEIIVALLWAREHDKYPKVREAAAQAVSLPVHRTFWQEHSDEIISRLVEDESAARIRLTPLTWSQAWTMAVFHPSVKTFEDISLNSGATRIRAFRWIWMSSLLTILVAAAIRNTQVLPGIGIPERIGVLFVYTVLYGSMIAVAVATALGLGAMVWTGILHTIAKKFRGKGTYVGLLNAVTAFLAPLMSVSLLIGLVSSLFAIPYLVWLGIPIQIYMLVLYIIAMKSVYRFGWGQAIASYSLGFLVLLVLLAGVVLLNVITIRLGTRVDEIFYEVIQRSQTPVP
jgi:hypothetical protein